MLGKRIGKWLCRRGWHLWDHTQESTEFVPLQHDWVDKRTCERCGKIERWYTPGPGEGH